MSQSITHEVRPGLEGMQTDLAPLIRLDELLLLQVPGQSLNSPRHGATGVMRADCEARKPVVLGVGGSEEVGFIGSTFKVCYISRARALALRRTKCRSSTLTVYVRARLRLAVQRDFQAEMRAWRMITADAVMDWAYEQRWAYEGTTTTIHLSLFQ